MVSAMTFQKKTIIFQMALPAYVQPICANHHWGQTSSDLEGKQLIKTAPLARYVTDECESDLSVMDPVGVS